MQVTRRHEGAENASKTPHGTSISGVAIATDIIERVKSAADALSVRTSIVPGLAVVIVGSDPASQVYVRSKGRRAKDCGFHSVEHALPADTTTDGVLRIIDSLNADPAIHGILVQLPLPSHIDTFRVTQAVRPGKDVDGFNLANVGKLHYGAIDDCLVPCTPAGCMILIRSVLGSDLSGKHAVVIGRSNIVGKPMAALLFHANATVTGLHSKTSNPEALCCRADILVAAAGRPGLVRRDWIKPGAVVIDVGINRVFSGRDDATGRLVGDVDFDAGLKVAAAITPVPGGVGPMTIAMLMANTVIAACRAAGVDSPVF